VQLSAAGADGGEVVVGEAGGGPTPRRARVAPHLLVQLRRRPRPAARPSPSRKPATNRDLNEEIRRGGFRSDHKTRAAEVLGIDPSTLYRKLLRYGMESAG
jgi:hypothetical protein